jgi:hypothetical protein
VWITVLVLAVAMSFEPSRPVWVPLMLARPRPMLQLFALFCGSFFSGLAAGLLVLFVFEQTPFGNDPADGATVQIGIGVLALLIAAVMATNFSFIRSARPVGRQPDGAVPEPATKPRAIDTMSDRARTILQKGNSPWLSGGIGVAIGAASLEFLAALVIIASSGVSKTAEVAALLMFLVVGNALITVPLVTYLFAPSQTRTWIERFQNWLRTRGRKEFAAILAAMGLIQVIIGVLRL